ncbi:MAG: DUF975 family protein [Eubacterium sp.]|nr:DUF975 family protein [Eubacterium sp.]
MWTRSELKDRAKDAYRRCKWGLIVVSIIIGAIAGGGAGGSWGNIGKILDDKNGKRPKFSGGHMSQDEMAVLIAVILAVLAVIAVVILFGTALGIFLKNPLMVGCKRYFVDCTTEDLTVSEISRIMSPFKKGAYGNTVKTMFLMQLFIFLWSMLFWIPGIVKSYEYRMIPYIMAEHPELSYKEAFRMSKEMMQGNKWSAFVLDLSFLGWHILGVMTLGILEIFYVAPYVAMTDAYLYKTLKNY